jgi:hypothetical protein
MNQQGPPPKVEPLNIKKIISEVKQNEDLNTKDKKIKHLKKNKVSKKKGEEEIGKVLVDEYVMPMLDKNKDKTE